MPKLSLKPITVTHPLINFDPSGETIGVFRQIPQSAVTRLAGLFSERTERIKDGGMVIENIVKWNGQELLAERVYESLVDFNLEEVTGFDAEGKEITAPLFTFGKGPNGSVPGSRSKFMETWGRISERKLIDDLYAGAIAANPQWNPETQGE